MTLKKWKLPLEFDVERLVQDLEALKQFDQAPQPGPYHKGEWTGIALRSAGGHASAAPSFPSLEDYDYTEAIEVAPYYREILDGLGFPLQVVRVLTLPPEGHIGEHVDFFTNFQFGLLRLHIPLVTHPDVKFLIEDTRCPWKAGEFHYGDFSLMHQVLNESPITRVHMVLDAEINDHLLSWFPEEELAEQRKLGITKAEEAVELSDEELAGYACSFKVPGKIMPLLVMGQLRELIKGARADVVPRDGRLVVELDGTPKFALRPLSGGRFMVVGFTAGCCFELAREGAAVTSVTLVVKGAPKNLVNARLGTAKGPSIPEQRIEMKLL